MANILGKDELDRILAEERPGDTPEVERIKGEIRGARNRQALAGQQGLTPRRAGLGVATIAGFGLLVMGAVAIAILTGGAAVPVELGIVAAFWALGMSVAGVAAYLGMSAKRAPMVRQSENEIKGLVEELEQERRNSKGLGEGKGKTKTDVQKAKNTARFTAVKNASGDKKGATRAFATEILRDLESENGGKSLVSGGRLGRESVRITNLIDSIPSLTSFNIKAMTPDQLGILNYAIVDVLKGNNPAQMNNAVDQAIAEVIVANKWHEDRNLKEIFAGELPPSLVWADANGQIAADSPLGKEILEASAKARAGKSELDKESMKALAASGMENQRIAELEAENARLREKNSRPVEIGLPSPQQLMMSAGPQFSPQQAAPMFYQGGYPAPYPMSVMSAGVAPMQSGMSGWTPEQLIKYTQLYREELRSSRQAAMEEGYITPPIRGNDDQSIIRDAMGKVDNTPDSDDLRTENSSDREDGVVRLKVQQVIGKHLAEFEKEMNAGKFTDVTSRTFGNIARAAGFNATPNDMFHSILLEVGKETNAKDDAFNAGRLPGTTNQDILYQKLYGGNESAIEIDDLKPAGRQEFINVIAKAMDDASKGDEGKSQERFNWDKPAHIYKVQQAIVKFAENNPDLYKDARVTSGVLFGGKNIDRKAVFLKHIETTKERMEADILKGTTQLARDPVGVKSKITKIEQAYVAKNTKARMFSGSNVSKANAFTLSKAIVKSAIDDFGLSAASKKEAESAINMALFGGMNEGSAIEGNSAINYSNDESRQAMVVRAALTALMMNNDGTMRDSINPSSIDVQVDIMKAVQTAVADFSPAVQAKMDQALELQKATHEREAAQRIVKLHNSNGAGVSDLEKNAAQARLAYAAAAVEQQKADREKKNLAAPSNKNIKSNLSAATKAFETSNDLLLKETLAEIVKVSAKIEADARLSGNKDGDVLAKKYEEDLIEKAKLENDDLSGNLKQALENARGKAALVSGFDFSKDQFDRLQANETAGVALTEEEKFVIVAKVAATKSGATRSADVKNALTPNMKRWLDSNSEFLKIIIDKVPYGTTNPEKLRDAVSAVLVAKELNTQLVTIKDSLPEKEELYDLSKNLRDKTVTSKTFETGKEAAKETFATSLQEINKLAEEALKVEKKRLGIAETHGLNGDPLLSAAAAVTDAQTALTNARADDLAARLAALTDDSPAAAAAAAAANTAVNAARTALATATAAATAAAASDTKFLDESRRAVANAAVPNGPGKAEKVAGIVKALADAEKGERLAEAAKETDAAIITGENAALQYAAEKIGLTTIQIGDAADIQKAIKDATLARKSPVDAAANAIKKAMVTRGAAAGVGAFVAANNARITAENAENVRVKSKEAQEFLAKAGTTLPAAGTPGATALTSAIAALTAAAAVGSPEAAALRGAATALNDARDQAAYTAALRTAKDTINATTIAADVALKASISATNNAVSGDIANIKLAAVAMAETHKNINDLGQSPSDAVGNGFLAAYNKRATSGLEDKLPGGEYATVASGLSAARTKAEGALGTKEQGNNTILDKFAAAGAALNAENLKESDRRTLIEGIIKSAPNEKSKPAVRAVLNKVSDSYKLQEAAKKAASVVDKADVYITRDGATARDAVAKAYLEDLFDNLNTEKKPVVIRDGRERRDGREDEGDSRAGTFNKEDLTDDVVRAIHTARSKEETKLALDALEHKPNAKTILQLVAASDNLRALAGLVTDDSIQLDQNQKQSLVKSVLDSRMGTTAKYDHAKTAIATAISTDGPLTIPAGETDEHKASLAAANAVIAGAGGYSPEDKAAAVANALYLGKEMVDMKKALGDGDVTKLGDGIEKAVQAAGQENTASDAAIAGIVRDAFALRGQVARATNSEGEVSPDCEEQVKAKIFNAAMPITNGDKQDAFSEVLTKFVFEGNIENMVFKKWVADQKIPPSELKAMGEGIRQGIEDPSQSANKAANVVAATTQQSQALQAQRQQQGQVGHVPN